MKKLLAIMLSLCLIISCFALLGVSQNYTPKVSIEKFSAELCEMNRKYKDEPVGNRLIVKSKRNIAVFDSVDVVEGYEDLHIIQFDNSESAKEALEYYNSSKLIEYAEPDITITACDVDYTSHLSWGSESIGTDDYFSYIENKEELPEIIVGVIDTGVELEHEFLKDRIIQTGVNYSDSGESGSENDDHGHGTHCAGIVVDNTLDNVKIEGFKALDSTGSGSSSNITSAIYAAIENNVNVISMSLGGPGHSDAMQEAVDLAISKNITVCASAGNNGDIAANYCPANLDGVITVAAHDENYEIPLWSNKGDIVDIIAPGVSIESSWLDNTYEIHSGTSMACPFVSAACSLLLSDDPQLSPEELINILQLNGKEYISSTSLNGKKILYIGNVEGHKQRTEKPIFITESDVYEDSVDVELQCNDANAHIYYTLDGSFPSVSNSMLYEEPIHLTQTTQIRAFALSENKHKSLLIMNEYYVASQEDDSMYEINDEGVITAYHGNNIYLKVPAKIHGIKVVGIGENVFYDSEMIRIFLPETIKTVGKKAFWSCSQLRQVNLPSVESIGVEAFEWCNKLTTVELKTPVSVEEKAFFRCDRLVNIDLSKLVNIERYSFYSCKALSSIYNDKLTKIPSSAFRDCKGLIYIELPNVTKVEDYGISYDWLLEHIKIPNLTEIGDHGMYNNDSLISVDFPKLNTLTGSHHFASCKSIAEISIPSFNGKLPNYCFTGMKNIETVKLDGVTELGKNSFEYSNIEKAIFKEVITMGAQAFRDTKIRTLYLPKVVTTGENTFNKAIINELFIPSLITAGYLPLTGEDNRIYLSDSFEGCTAITGAEKNCTIIALAGSYADTFAHMTIEQPRSKPNEMKFIDSYSLVHYIGSYSYKGKTHYDFCLENMGDILELADNIDCRFTVNGEEVSAEGGAHKGDNLYLSFTAPDSTDITSLRACINIDGMEFKSPELTDFGEAAAVDALPENECEHSW